MKRIFVAGIILVAFSVGCMTTMVASTIVFPEAHAQDAVKWEQICKPMISIGLEKNVEMINTEIATAGQNGWELVSHAINSTSSSVICMKRRM